MHPLPVSTDTIDALLPQTQCTRCGYPDCRSYADAIAKGEAAINRCPPGGQEGVVRLAELTGQAALPLDADCGQEGPRLLALIDEDWCIGCTLCIKACPVDAIVGANKLMHSVVNTLCTGCELCVPVCPVDCISLHEATPGRSGWQAWSEQQANEARERYAFHRFRTERDKHENDERLAAKAQRKLDNLVAESRLTDPDQLDRKRAVIEAAMARARERNRKPD
nr:electron transport complex subunit RsxB [uncultured Caldimonas sp.]